MYDLLIVGCGPAGMTSAIYAARAGLKCAIIEKGAPGGQLVNTKEVANYTGFQTQSGPDIAMAMYNHISEFNIEVKYSSVQKIIDKTEFKVVSTDQGDLETKAVLIATGTPVKTLKASNTNKFAGNGISWCATCDGAFYKNMDVCLIGNTQTAIEEALFLTDLCSKVTLISNGKEISCDKKILDLFTNKSNTSIIDNAVVVGFDGEKKLSKVIYKDISTKEDKELDVKGAFIYIGNAPMTELVKDLDITDEKGYIVTNEMMETKVKNIFAAGDVRQKQVRQIVTATSDGCIAAQNILFNIKTSK